MTEYVVSNLIRDGKYKLPKIHSVPSMRFFTSTETACLGAVLQCIIVQAGACMWTGENTANIWR